MATEITNQFTGLPMDSLIGAPLLAACNAQLKLANSTATFINTVGFEDKDKNKVRTIDFKYQNKTPKYDDKGEIIGYETTDMLVQTPLLSIVKIPTLSITDLNITFDMEIKTSEEEKTSDDKSGTLEAEASFGFGCFKAKVNVKGSISSHKENSRKTDTSAKYHVELQAKDGGMPEGLSRVLDIIQNSITPVESNKLKADTSSNKKQEE
ncbi:DUF2589 domain-containing protein [Aliarcobacter vitoriensis]|uniref:DUF2589 domain-containing protein n=1 Tax=Aliarcobacter vitoriensis TaxID=2011099 RepID=A0A366MPN3_9BACT|nr:DUF2589 domain-containing protein [Aliarcobacter vitoriensis]RBQ27977.1 hypothetical protein CRU91_11620 [Aliarcobacter vitoriensis]